MFFWLIFRLRQAQRLLFKSGIILLVLALVLTVGIWSRLLLLLESCPAYFFVLGSVLLIGGLHLWRSDRRFLAQGRITVWKACFIDYLLVLFPVILLACLQGRGVESVLWLSGLLWLFATPGSWIRYQKIRLYKPIGWLPRRSLEWHYLWRTQWFMLVLVVVLGLLSVWHPGFFAGGAFLMWMSLQGGFEYLEPRAQLPVNRKEAIQRWRQSAWTMHAFLLPGYLLVPIHGLAFFALVVYVMLASEALLLFSFAVKWSSWYHGRRRLYNPAIFGLALLYVLLPGFILILIAQTVYYSRKAVINLQI